MINVAIDGPSGAGKSSIARRVSSKLGFLYIDTGAMFRSLAYKAIKEGLDISEDNAALKDCLNTTNLDVRLIDGLQHMILDGADITDYIRTPEVSIAASDIAVIGFVREWILNLERSLASKNNCIMDGRDIGTSVLPRADVKIFLTASAEARAKRRYLELCEKKAEVSFEEVLSDMKYRDEQDSSRRVSPLKKADDAILVDTTNLDFDQSVERILNIIKKVIK